MASQTCERDDKEKDSLGIKIEIPNLPSTTRNSIPRELIDSFSESVRNCLRTKRYLLEQFGRLEMWLDEPNSIPAIMFQCEFFKTEGDKVAIKEFTKEMHDTGYGVRHTPIFDPIQFVYEECLRTGIIRSTSKPRYSCQEIKKEWIEFRIQKIKHFKRYNNNNIKQVEEHRKFDCRDK